MTDSVETACQHSGGLVVIELPDRGEELSFSQNYACEDCGISLTELEPRMFSFNNPYGACQTCTGLGIFMKVNPDLLIPNKNLSISEGAICASGWGKAEQGSISAMYYNALGKEYGFTLKTPIRDISPDGFNAILYGTDHKLKMARSTNYGIGTYISEFEGIINNLERRYRETTSDWAKWEIEQVMSASLCPDLRQVCPSCLLQR